ncbi:MAG: DNA (cytosine-5-)-methyltransferase [Candidatus Scalindua sp.]|nr:DNA (cytosine-5-)-methyltransferase [Candidatus Scalindua sp.]
MEKIKPKIISLFSGCGGFDLGFHEVGYKTIWANDLDAQATKTFERNFGKIITEKNIEEIDPYADNTIPECDLILGGFPCQDFSVIWKQPGLNGDRGNLYKSFLRFIDAKKPKAFVAENVKSLLTANKKQAIEQIIKDFAEIGPGYLIKIQLYNFAEYGVPQFRERVLIVGIRLDTGYNFTHPYPICGPKTDKPYMTAGEALKDAEKILHNNEHMNISFRT